MHLSNIRSRSVENKTCGYWPISFTHLGGGPQEGENIKLLILGFAARIDLTDFTERQEHFSTSMCSYELLLKNNSQSWSSLNCSHKLKITLRGLCIVLRAVTAATGSTLQQYSIFKISNLGIFKIKFKFRIDKL